MLKSPFINENTLYFGGFDPNGKTATSKAWIFKKKYQTNSAKEQTQNEIKINVYPNPAINQLNVISKQTK